jgi:hypothetical protein
MPLVNKIAFAAWAVVAACIALWTIAMYPPDPFAEFLAVASLNDSAVRIDDVSCLSIGPHQIVMRRIIGIPD